MCNGFVLPTVKLKCNVSGIILKDSAYYLYGSISLKICMVSPDMCDYQTVSQIFFINLEIKGGNII